MPRKKTNSVHKFYVYNSDKDISKCLVLNCKKEMKGKHASNLAKHLQVLHKREFELMMQENKMKKYNLVTKVGTENKINNNTPIDECVNLVVVHGRPVSLMDDRAFKNILGLTKSDSKTVINSQIIRDVIAERAEKTRRELHNLLKSKLLTLKIDIASCHVNSFLAIHALFIRKGKLETRTLHIDELLQTHTFEAIKDKLIYIQNIFGINLKQVYSIILDNGSNIVKMKKLVEGAVNGNTLHAVECDNIFDLADDGTSDCGTNIITIDEIEDLIFEDCSEVAERYSVTSIKCAASILQLAVQDSLKDESVQSILECARRVVNELRSTAIQEPTKPKLDCLARWSSTLEMLEKLLEMRFVCSKSSNHNLYLTDITWSWVELIINALKPPYNLNKKLLTEQFTLGDFYLNWLNCKLSIQKFGSSFATSLYNNMDQREKHLFTSKEFLSALYLDPRINFMLNLDQRNIAIEHLHATWLRLEVCSLMGESSGQHIWSDISIKNEDSAVTSLLTDFLDRSYQEVMKTNVKQSPQCNFDDADIETKLKDFYDKKVRLPPDANILDYWEEKKKLTPQLYSLAAVALSIPSSEESLQRLYSSLDFVFNKLQTNLKHYTTDDILLLKNNNSIDLYE